MMSSFKCVRRPSLAGLTRRTPVGTIARPAATTIVPTMPTGTVSGDVVVVFVHRAAASALTASTGWTSVTSTSTHMEVFRRVMDGGANDTLTVTCASSRIMAAIAVAYSGQNATTPVAGVATTNNSIDPPSLTPSWGSVAGTEFIVAAATGRTDNSLSLPSGYANGFDVETIANSSANSEITIMVGFRSAATVTEDPAAFGSTGSLDTQRAATVAIQPA
jgi:hypothetical protein